MVWAVKTFLHTSDQCTLGDNKSTGLPLHLQEASACSSLEFPCRTVTSFLHVGLYNLGILSWLEICHVESGVSIRAPPTSSDPPLYNILQRRVNRHAPPLLLAFFRHMCFYLWRRLIWPSWHFPHCSVQWLSVFFSRYKGLRALCRVFGGEVLKLLHFDISGWVSFFFLSLFNLSLQLKVEDLLSGFGLRITSFSHSLKEPSGRRFEEPSSWSFKLQNATLHITQCTIRI